jgi:hypothetical protein
LTRKQAAGDRLIRQALLSKNAARTSKPEPRSLLWAGAETGWRSDAILAARAWLWNWNVAREALSTSPEERK